MYESRIDWQTRPFPDLLFPGIRPGPGHDRLSGTQRDPPSIVLSAKNTQYQYRHIRTQLYQWPGGLAEACACLLDTISRTWSATGAERHSKEVCLWHRVE